jgi:hypothetical protein
MRRQRRKEVWQFVFLAAKQEFWHLADQDLRNEHAGSAFCQKCKRTIAFQSTSNKVLAHMERYHRTEMKEFLAEASKNNDGASRDLTEAFADAAAPPRKRVARQLTSEEQKRVNRLLAQWIARHFRPMLMIEDDGFVAFVRFITEDLGNVHVKLPKRTQLRKEIESLARDLRSQICALISEGCLFFSITSDIWTARNARSYIACTLHYVNEQFYPVNWTLEVKELPGIHDSGAIASSLENILFDWSLPLERCAMLVRDAGSNMVRAAVDMGVNNMSCIAHGIHLVVSGMLIKPRMANHASTIDPPTETESVIEYEDELLDGEQETLHDIQELAIQELETYLDETFTSLQINELDAVRGVVQSFRSLAVYFRKSPKARNRLSRIQQDEFSVPPQSALNLKVDCPTRWNSCFDMLERFLALKPALHSFFVYLGTPAGRNEFKDVKRTLFQPKGSEWLTVSCLKALLVPFGSATKILSGQLYPTVPLILPALSSIRRRLSDRNLFDRALAFAGNEDYVHETKVVMQACRERVLELFDQRFSALESSDLMWIAYLDPRVARKMSHLTPATRPIACANIVGASLELAKQFDRLRSDGSPLGSISRSPDENAEDNGDVGADIFGDDLDEPTAADLERACNDEFTNYLAEKHTVKTSDDPFDWWRVNRHKYPNLSRLARKWLGVVATSVPSERAFSTSGNVITVKRSSLAPDMVRDLVFVSENWRV